MLNFWNCERSYRLLQRNGSHEVFQKCDNGAVILGEMGG